MVSCCKKPKKDPFWNKKDQWKRAAINTSVCLLGCSIGDFSAIIYFAFHAPSTPYHIQMIVAICAGLSTSVLLETLLMRLRENFAWRAALKVALGMSMISMIAMEIAMNVVDFHITSTYQLTVTDIGYWLAFIPALIAGYFTPLPYNYWRLVKFNKGCCG